MALTLTEIPLKGSDSPAPTACQPRPFQWAMLLTESDPAVPGTPPTESNVPPMNMPVEEAAKARTLPLMVG